MFSSIIFKKSHLGYQAGHPQGYYGQPPNRPPYPQQYAQRPQYQQSPMQACLLVISELITTENRGLGLNLAIRRRTTLRSASLSPNGEMKRRVVVCLCSVQSADINLDSLET